MEGEMRLFVSKTYHLSDHEIISPEMLESEKLYMFNDEEMPEINKIIHGYFNGAGVSPNYIECGNSLAEILVYVESGLGAAILPSYVNTVLLPEQEIKMIKLEGLNARPKLELYWNSDTPNPCVTNYVEEIYLSQKKDR